MDQKTKEPLQYKVARFMRGRYGNDRLNQAMLVFALVMTFIGSLANNVPAILASDVIIILCFVRMLSKNIVRRQVENNTYLELTAGIRHYSKASYLSVKDKQYRYVVCPNCKQICRIPRGRGKIEITCPKCRTSFKKKS